MNLEHEARVIVETAAERGRELHGAHIDAAGGEKAGAGLEQIDGRAERELRVGGQRAQFGGGFVGTAAYGEEAFDQRARFARQPGAGAERRLFQKPFGDFADRAAADRRDAGDRKQIGDQIMRGLRIRTPSAASTP